MSFLDDAVHDARYGVRLLRRAPGFSAIVVITLALGIGGTTAMVSVANAVWWNPWPFRDASRFVRISELALATPTGPRRLGGTNALELAAIARESRAFSHVIEYGTGLVSLPGDTVRSVVAPMPPAAFAMTRAVARWGRTFVESDGERVAVLSDRAWRGHFHADPGVIGQVIRFDGDRFSGGVVLGAPYTIVGVMPPSFQFPNDDAQYWVPLPHRSNNPPLRRVQMMATLAPDVTPEAAGDDVTRIVRALRSAPASPLASRGESRFDIVRIEDEVGAEVRPAVRAFLGAVSLLLLIACANIAALFLARASAREREMAVRISLGATRWRLVRQVLAECGVFAIVGGGLGIVAGLGFVELFRLSATTLSRIDLGSGPVFPRLQSIRVDAVALAASLVTAVACGFLFGAIPAARAAAGARIDRRRWTPGPMVVLEVALATLLIASGGLLVRSFLNLSGVPRGFDPNQVLTFQVTRSGAARPTADQKAFAEQLVERLRQGPGVDGAAYANQVPLVRLEDHQPMRTTAAPPAVTQSPADMPDARLVSSDYLRVMRTRIVAGRGLTAADADGAPRVVVLNETLAARDFPAENPIGRTVYLGHNPNPWEIVGIVGDLRQFDAQTPASPQFFADIRQWSEATGTPIFPVGAYYALRSRTSVADALVVARQAVQALDPAATLQNIASMDQLVSNGLARPRLYAVLVGMLAALGVVLAAAGVYGVMSFAVQQRVREIGVRVALGAREVDVLRAVLGRSAALTGAGVVTGLAAAVVAVRWLDALVFGVTTRDPAVFASAAVALAGVSIVAAVAPARRALRIEPAEALRVE